MVFYDSAQPLAFIHIPKTAGTSVRKLFEQWFTDGLLLHYYKETLVEMPVRHDLFAEHTPARPVCVYGHFNRRRNFGVEDYYPEVRQFITIMRDPMERLISNYFYLRKVAQGWAKYPEPIDPDLRNYLLNNRSTMLNYFPREVTVDNYKEIIEKYFIEIGTVETIRQSMQRIARSLQRPYRDEMLERTNSTERSQLINSDLRSIFMEHNRLEFTVYEYVANVSRGAWV